MKSKKVKSILSLCMAAAVLTGSIPVSQLEARAEGEISTAVESGLTIKESEINQLLTGDLTLPTSVDGLEGAEISYSVGNADSRYVSIEGNTLKVTRPYAGEEDYSFTLTATVTLDGESATKEFPLTIRAGLSDDSYAGYIYTCFAANDDGKDVQQVHFFLSEDGLNWTALNGCNPAFLAGDDYLDQIQQVSAGSVNYQVAPGTNVAETVSGDASVLFPFEGDDQGIRDPYLLRGSKADGSDSNKVWLLATDLNTMAPQYGGNLASNTVGNWGTMSSKGSTSLFIYETEDWVHWERRYVDLGAEIDAGAAWAPEAIYNPAKDNYLVYWSCRVNTDGLSRNRLYCNETEDFVTFGPTKMYEMEPFWMNWIGKDPGKADDGFGNIDTSQLWVADEEGNPYGTLFRLVKDETNNHIELMSADTVLDPNVDYEETDPTRITPYEKDGVTYVTVQDISDLESHDKAEVVYNWFINESTGNHFQKISQSNMEAMSGAYEGATMFKFIDRDEWCIMIDYYGNNSVRYEPYVTYDLSEPDSITKVESGYGRTGGDVGCHGGMIPITVKEYNTLIETYNSDPEVDNYHPIDYIEVDKRELADTIKSLEAALKDTVNYDDFARKQIQNLLDQANALNEKANASTAEIEKLIKRAEQTLKDKKQNEVPGAETPETPDSQGPTTGDQTQEPEVTKVTVNKKKLTLGVKETFQLAAQTAPADASDAITFSSSKKSVAAVSANGKITAKRTGKTVITATAANGKKATCTVTVKKAPKKITTKVKTKTLKKGKSFKIKVNLAKNAASNKLTYKSSKPKVVSVSKNGKVTAKKKGTATITVRTYNGKKATIKVTVR